MKMTTLMTAAAGMVLTVALTACGGGGAGSTTDPTTSGDASATTSAPAGEAGGSVGVSMPTQTTERWIADGAAGKSQLAEAGFGVALPGVGDGVAQGQCQFTTTGLQEVEVFGRGFGHLCGGLGIGDGLGINLRESHTQGVVHTALTTCQNIHELGLLSQRNAGQCGGAKAQCQSDFSNQFHGWLLLVTFVSYPI